jgi:hypothetical protein
MQGNPERDGRNSVCHREAADRVGRLLRVLAARKRGGACDPWNGSCSAVRIYAACVVVFTESRAAGMTKAPRAEASGAEVSGAT